MQYYGATAGNYAAGDYYYPYRAGGIFGILGGVVKGAIGGITGGPLGMIKGGIAGGVSAAKGKQTVGTALAPLPLPTMLPGPIGVPKGTPGGVPVPGVIGGIQRMLPGGATGYQGGPAVGGAPAGWHWNKSYSYAKGLPAGSFLVRNRSMNPGNARSLRRAVRRQQSFVALARRVMKGTGMTIKRSGMGGARKRARR